MHDGSDSGHQSGSRTARPSAPRARNKSWWVPYLFLLIPVALFLLWVIGPMIYSFYLSLTNWDGVSAPKFIGLRNYVRLFDDKIFWTSIA